MPVSKVPIGMAHSPMVWQRSLAKTIGALLPKPAKLIASATNNAMVIGWSSFLSPLRRDSPESIAMPTVQTAASTPTLCTRSTPMTS